MYILCSTNQASSVKMAGYWPKFYFFVFMDWDEVEVYKNAKREWGQYLAILTELACSIEDILYGLKNTEKVVFLIGYFRAPKRGPAICKSDGTFQFSGFLVAEKSQNIFFTVAENFREAAYTAVKCYCGNKTGSPERSVSLHLARSGSQSQRRIWFILPDNGACYIIS